MYGITTKFTNQNKFVHANEEGYPLSIGNQRILTIPMENFYSHNLVYIEPIMTT
jgi:hypothetical protein